MLSTYYALPLIITTTEEYFEFIFYHRLEQTDTLIIFNRMNLTFLGPCSARDPTGWGEG